MTGAAWLSSARVVRCTVNSGNERNPHGMLNYSYQTAVTQRRKERTTSNQHGPYIQGYTRATMAGTKGSQTARWSKSHSKPVSVRIEV